MAAKLHHPLYQSKEFVGHVDSLAIAYNKLDWGTLYEPGIAKQIGKTSGYLAEQYGRHRQCITLLQAFNRAHHALLNEMDKGWTYTEFADEFYELNRQVLALSELLVK